MDIPAKPLNKMATETRIPIVDAVKRIVESTWRGREHTAEEVVTDIRNFLQEENEENITEIEWQEILDKFPIVNLSGRIFQIKDIFISEYGKGESIQELVKEEKKEVYVTSDDPIEQEQELIQQLRTIRKRGVKKIVSLYKEMFSNTSYSPTENELLDFIKKNTLERRENRKTVIIALSRIVGSEMILAIFNLIDEEEPIDSRQKRFELWVQKQKEQMRK